MTVVWEGAAAALVLVPLAAAALAFVLPRCGAALGLASSAVGVAAALVVAGAVRDAGPLRHRVGGWGAPLGIDLRADGTSALLLLVVAGIGAVVAVYARTYLRGDGHGHGGARGADDPFWPLWLLLSAALSALLLGADVFNLYVTLELVGLSAVALVALAGGRDATVAAMRYLLVGLTGSLLYLMGVAVLYGAYATVDLELLARRARPDAATWVALSLMTGGLLLKSALFPLHFWLPPAHANAPAPVSALLSALVVKGSFYILLRLWLEAFAPLVATFALTLLGLLGAGAILWGSMQALLQTRLKLLVAYSTVAQLGYLLLVFPLAHHAGAAARDGVLLFVLAHACAKTAMFLAAGNLVRAAGHDRIADLAGVTHVLPLSVFAFALAGTSLVGLPPSGGFAAKWLLLDAGIGAGAWGWVALILLGSLLAAAYVMRFVGQAFVRADVLPAARPVPATMEWTALGLALASALLGLVAGWPLGLLQATGPAGVAS